MRLNVQLRPYWRINLPRPPIHAALAPLLDSCQLPEALDIDLMRNGLTDEHGNVISGYTADIILAYAPHLQHVEYDTAGGSDGNVVVLSVFSPRVPTSKTLPALYHVHGGDMISGDRFTGLMELVNLLHGIESIIISIEYRLAPEAHAPGPAQNCYARLVWIAANAATLGIKPSEIIILGTSRGAALAAATCLMAHDRNFLKPPIKGQMLLSPMLDDRCDTVSDRQFELGSPWSGQMNRSAWRYILGHAVASDGQNVHPHQAPGRAQDLSGLPSTYINMGECNILRDPAISYASRMWQAGSTCELHVWPGYFHLFDGMDNPEIPIVSAAVETKRIWLRSMMIHRPSKLEGK